MTISASSDVNKVKTFGQSMEPLFRDGDSIEFEKIPFSKINIEDVITYIKYDKLISHRVIYKNKDYVITKGDNNEFADNRVNKTNILGKVKRIHRSNQSIELNSIYLYQSAIYWREISKLKILFEKEGIGYLILKGLPLYLYYKKDPPKRIYADCDFLIHNLNVQKVEKTFLKLGYIKRPSHNSFLPTFLETSRPEITYEKRVKKVLVSFDIHTEITFLMKTFGDLNPIYPNKLIDGLTNMAFEKTELVKIEGLVFPILMLPQLILYLSLHLFSHNLKGYNRYELLAFILKNKKVDFEELSNNIVQYKLQNYIYPVFLLLIKYYKVKLPQSFLRKVSPGIKERKYIKQKMLNRSAIFGNEQKWQRGSNRFNHIFNLSPNKLIQRILIFIKPHIIYAIVWVLIQRYKKQISILKMRST